MQQGLPPLSSSSPLQKPPPPPHWSPPPRRTALVLAPACTVGMEGEYLKMKIRERNPSDLGKIGEVPCSVNLIDLGFSNVYISHMRKRKESLQISFGRGQ